MSNEKFFDGQRVKAIRVINAQMTLMGDRIGGNEIWVKMPPGVDARLADNGCTIEIFGSGNVTMQIGRVDGSIPGDMGQVYLPQSHSGVDLDEL